MNNWIRFTVMILIALVGFGGCDSEETESLANKNTRILQLGPWMVTKVLVGSSDETASFNGMTVTFLPETYVATGGGLVWPELGTWNLILPEATSFERDGDIEVTIVEITDDSLVLEFDWQGTLGPGRINSIQGTYRFFFSR
jgi:hypothetical protein